MLASVESTNVKWINDEHWLCLAYLKPHQYSPWKSSHETTSRGDWGIKMGLVTYLMLLFLLTYERKVPRHHLRSKDWGFHQTESTFFILEILFFLTAYCIFFSSRRLRQTSQHWWSTGRWISEFKEALAYKANSRTIQRNSEMKKKKKKQRKQKDWDKLHVYSFLHFIFFA